MRCGDVVLCKLLSGASYRLRATSKIGDFARNGSLLPKFGISLAEAFRAGTRNALGHESGPTAPVSPLRDKTATYPAEYGKRAGELIARAVRSLHPTLRHKKRR